MMFKGCWQRLAHKAHRVFLVLALTAAMLLPAGDQAFGISGNWTTKASMPTPRSHLGVGAMGNVLYAVGGFNGFSGAQLGTLEAYDSLANTWTTKAPMPTPRSHLAVGVVNSVLYAVGGFSFPCGCSLATVKAYDPATDTWTTKASMLTARHSPAVGVVNGILYVVGGRTNPNASGAWLASMEAYDPTTDTWTSKSPMPTARGHLAAAVVNGTLYAIGGIIDNPNTIYATVEAYDPTTDTWTTKPPMPTPRWALAAAVVGNNAYAVGGASCNGNCPLATAEAYDVVSNSWTQLTPMPTARGWLAAGAGNNASTVYAVGGSTCNFPTAGPTCPGGQWFTVNEGFTPVTAIPFSSFAANADIGLSRGSFHVNGTFTLGQGTNGINPVTDPVTITVGTFSITVPAGSFQQTGDGGWLFLGTISGVGLNIKVTPHGGPGTATFGINIEATGASLSGTTSPTTVSLTIGSNTGSTLAQTHIQ